MGRLTACLVVILLSYGCGGAQVTASPSAAIPTTSAPIDTPSTPAVPGSGVFRALTDFPAAGAYEVTGVTASANGWLAVGFGAQPGEDYFGLRQGIVWRSDDGVTWQESVEPALVNVTPLHVATFGADVYIVGVLATCSESNEEPCAEPPDAGNGIWRAVDGGDWQRLPVPAGMQGAVSMDELAAGPGLMAISGSAGDESATSTVWASTDGTTWTETTDLAGLDPIDALAAGPVGLVAFGTVLAEDEEFVNVHGAVSADGIRFSPTSVPALANAAIIGVAAGGSGMSAVGYGENDDLDLSVAALFSADGITWIPATPSDGSFSNSGMLEVHAIPDGYVALGFTPSDDDFADQEGASWISRDGRTWRGLAPIGDTSAVLTSSAAGASGLIVFTAIQDETEEDVTSTISAWFAPISELNP